MSGTAEPATVHGSCVAFGSFGILITGASGTGKSALALELIGLGAQLVSDDLTRLSATPQGPVCESPGRMQGVIEARGVGLLKAPFQPSAPLRLVVDLDRVEPDRLPPRRGRSVMGQEIDLLFRIDAPYFAQAIRLVATGGRYA